MSETLTQLQEKLDQAAIKLLQEAFEATTSDAKTGESEGLSTPKLTIRDRTSVFEAVQKYLSSRETKRPGGKGQTKVDEYRDRINGRTGKRGRDPASSEAAPGDSEPIATA